MDVKAWALAKAFQAMMGPAAEAKFDKKAFRHVWLGTPGSNDRADMARDCDMAGVDFDNALTETLPKVEAALGRPEVWRLVLALARGDPVNGGAHWRPGGSHRAGALDGRSTISEARNHAGPDCFVDPVMVVDYASACRCISCAGDASAISGRRHLLPYACRRAVGLCQQSAPKKNRLLGHGAQRRGTGRSGQRLSLPGSGSAF